MKPHEIFYQNYHEHNRLEVLLEFGNHLEQEVDNQKPGRIVIVLGKPFMFNNGQWETHPEPYFKIPVGSDWEVLKKSIEKEKLAIDIRIGRPYFD